MNLYFRLIRIIFLSFFVKPQRDVYFTSCSRFRCWPTDLDMNLHMNNGRYLTIMDLGRFFLMMELRVFWPVIKNRWVPVVASAKIDFKKSIPPLRKFTLETRIKSFDEKWIYIEQVYKIKDVIYATGEVKTALLAQGKVLPTQKMVDLLESVTAAGASRHE